MAQAAPAARAAPAGASGCARHRPEQTLLYRIVASHYPAFVELLAGQGRPLPEYVQRECDAYLKCGRLEHGFLRVRCESCHAEHLDAFSCKRRGFWPSCGARRMAESAALLADEVFPEQPVRQWGLSVPYPLRFLFASRPDILGAVLGIVYRVIATHLARTAGFSAKRARTGAVTLIQPLRGCAQPQRALPHAVPRRGVRRGPRGRALLPLGEGAHRRRAQRARAAHRQPRGPFSGTPGPARTRCRKREPFRARPRRGADAGAARALDHLPHRGGAARRAQGVHAAEPARRR